MEIPKKSIQYRAERGRYNYCTPKNYLDFLSNFNKQYKINKRENTENVKWFEKGLEKLHESGEKISILKTKIDKEMIKVKSSKEIVEKMLIDIKKTA